MSKGFIFNSGKCVSCGACSAACNLYKGWETRRRNIYTYLRQFHPEIPVYNISLACNHCGKASCLESCPSGALTRDSSDGPVLLDETKCLGCRYCQWNCPFDAPKFNHGKRVMEKCSLCNDSPDELPSCTTACPTGALKYMEITEKNYDNFPGWLYGKKLEPALNFAGEPFDAPEIIPSGIFTEKKEIISKIKSRESDWSLIVFSFISLIAVALQASSFIRGTFPGITFFALPFAAAVISLFHLGKPARAWRAVFKPLSSPVSREIIFFILFASLSAIAAARQSQVFSLASSVAGILLLIIIDSIYFSTDRKAFFHSGQTFLSALLLIAYFTGNLLPFTFIVALKVVFSAGKLLNKNMQPLLFLRIAMLLVVWAGLIMGFAETSLPVTFLIITSELIDRILFYIDFRPENISQVTVKYINDQNYEKKRG